MKGTGLAAGSDIPPVEEAGGVDGAGGAGARGGAMKLGRQPSLKEQRELGVAAAARQRPVPSLLGETSNRAADSVLL